MPSGDPDHGHIVYLETGTGKTYIAIMLLKLIFAQTGQEAELPQLKGLLE
jgi:ERCC4-related helicase